MVCLTVLSLHHTHHHQPWERSSIPLHTYQQVTTGGIEEVMESQPYGVEVSLLVVRAFLLH